MSQTTESRESDQDKIEIRVPKLPESVADATLVTWHKKPGETVRRDENLVDIETDKVVFEVPAPGSGVLQEIFKHDGATVVGDEVIAMLAGGATIADSPAGAKPVAAKAVQSASAATASAVTPGAHTEALSPAVRRLVNEHGLSAEQIPATGKDGRLTKTDVLNFLQQPAENSAAPPTPAARAPAPTRPHSVPATPTPQMDVEPGVRRVPMSRLRQRIAERMVEAQQTAAILTTFNEVNMQAVMDLRRKYKDVFEKQHGVKLGFMSFFIKACVEALRKFPVVNASTEEGDVLYHDYFDVSLAVSTPRGLVVPVLRDADQLDFAEIEAAVVDFAQRARASELTIEELTGGTFTITNGGVFGSLLSTPILNPPQSAILGMHKIQERAVVENGEIVARPMMYVALSYDHRIIDGREAVQFLVTVKDLLEEPTRLLLRV